MTVPKISALAPWFGSNRMLGPTVGAALGKLEWCGVPFCGGLAEIPHIQARTIVRNDLHSHVINLARVTAHPIEGPWLWRRLRRLAFHPKTLEESQRRILANEKTPPTFFTVNPGGIDIDGWNRITRIQLAEDYFVCCWMGRSGKAGTEDEFKGNIAFRWEAGGGDSVVRFRNAIDGLREWRKILARCTFDCRDAFEFLDKCKDQEGHGLYVDPPWPDDGDGYTHKFTTADHHRLRDKLSMYGKTRVVIRYGDHPLIRDLYTGCPWHWLEQDGRTAANKKKAEVLITNGRGG